MKRYAEYKDSGIEWIGEIPKEWNVKRFGFLFSFGRGLSITKSDLLDEGVPCISYGEIHSKYGFSVNPEINQLKCADTVFLEISPQSLLSRGDFVFADTSEDTEGSGNFTCLNSDTPVFAGYHSIIVRQKDKHNYRYLSYLFDSANFRTQIRCSVNGIKVYSITQSLLKNVYVLLPSKCEQDRIAAYLDAKTNSIDALIADKQKLIDLLKEKRQAIISEAVTKGLDKTAKMKDSDIDWVRKIPGHWRISKIKYLFKLRNERNYLPMDEVRLLSLYTELGVLPHDELEKTTGNKAVTVEDYKKVCKDDIVVNIILCWMGAIGISDYDGVTSPAYDVYQPDSSDIDSRYYHYLFRTSMFSGACYKVGRGIMAMRWRTYSNEFRSIFVPVPPLAEQRKILQYLDKKISQINYAISDIQTQIEKLQEYRQSIISEAVTGKVAV